MRKLLFVVLALLPAIGIAQTPVGPGSPSHFFGPSNWSLGNFASLSALQTAFPAAIAPVGYTAYITDDQKPAWNNGTSWTEFGSGGGSGTVTSVAGADGSTTPIFGWSAAVTTSGTLTETLLTQNANQVLAGPTSGSAAQPAFRVLVAADIPTIPSTQVSGLGTLATQSGTFSGTSSGTNTGDQTITLTGAVTGSGTGSFATTYAGINGVATGGTGASTLTGVVVGNGTSAFTTDTTTGTGSVLALATSPSLTTPALTGSSTGLTTLASANAGASNFTATFPAATDTVVELAATQTLSNKTFTAPALGAATATSINGNTFTTGTYTLTGTAAKTLTFQNSLTFAGSDSTTHTFPNASSTVAELGVAETFTALQTLTGLTTSGAAVIINNAGASNISVCSTSCSGTITIGNSSNTGKLVLAGLSTGTAADVMCIASGGVIILQAAGSCTISSVRFKDNVTPWDGDALPELAKLKTFTFTMKAAKEPNRDPNYASKQIGLTAEEIAKVEPKCSIYERDMKTPKSYRVECVLAMVIKGEQELMQQNAALRAQNVALSARVLKLESAPKMPRGTKIKLQQPRNSVCVDDASCTMAYVTAVTRAQH